MNNKKKIVLFLSLGITILSLITAISSVIRYRGRELFIPAPYATKELKGIVNFSFKDASELQEWKDRIFNGKVKYSIKSDSEGNFLSAESKNSASGLIYWIKFDLKKKPMISWKWKVTKFPKQKEDTCEKTGWIEEDDYAARFYVIFPRFPFYRMECLEYVWDENTPKDKVLTNPNFNNLKVIIAESGKQNMNKWVYIERNVYQDFKKAFGKEPTRVGAIAIMTDSDNTKSAAEAQYKDIEVGYENQQKKN